MEFERLIKHMSAASRTLFEQAVATASSRGHASMDIEHWLHEAVQSDDPALQAVFTHFGLDTARVEKQILAALENLRGGHEGFPKIAPDTARLLFEGWMVASSHYESLEIRPVHLLLALMESAPLQARLLRISDALQSLDAEAMRSECDAVLRGEMPSAQSAGGDAPAPTKTPALDQFTIDLTGEARAGRIDTILGRDDEIRQMIDILCRRRQNNPILTGEAGVGKTAVVEGLARRIVDGEVPELLRDVSLRVLDMGLLQAGAGVKGEFENRLKNVIKEVQQSATPVILFIDEAHTLVGAGQQSGAGDAANLLKPALARGDLRTIAATTWAEYKKYFESDAALTRRFQVVKIEEPSEDQATIMLRAIAPSLEHHHGVVILDAAIVAAVKLSHRYITGRQLPDKCVSLLDTACARVNLSQSAMPARLERLGNQVQTAEAHLARLQREQSTGHDHQETVDALGKQLANLRAEKETLSARWAQATQLLASVAALRQDIERANDAETDTDQNATGLRETLRRTRELLADLQGQQPMVHECVDEAIVAEVVADWTGIPVGRMQTDEIRGVLGLKDALSQRVIGQHHAIDLIARTMRTARAQLADPKRPLGVFLLVGPSGVGKTETALALAEQLYGSEQAITVINMSEFKEEHKVSLLMGSPPGYVGYGEGGVLTEAVRRKPYSVVLLDEMEKAHPGVQDIFYQVFDKGMLKDGQGRDIDFRNTVIIMTSNAGSDQVEKLCIDPDTRPDHEGLLDAIGPTLREFFKPAFLGRVNVVPYFPLEPSELRDITALQLSAVQQRVADHYGIPLRFNDGFIQGVIDRCRDSDTGARQIHRVLNEVLLPRLSESVLTCLADGADMQSIQVDYGDDKEISIAIESNPKNGKKEKPKKRRSRKKETTNE